MAAFTAAGTSYATHGEPMIPIYVFYSMFGFQRTGDALWAAADQMARGFLIGATAGRTTLTGEGLQHADGHSPLLAATNPAVVTYDPAYGYEIGHIVNDGLRADVRRRHAGPQRHLLHHRLQRADRRSRPSRRTSTSRACSRACTCSRRRRGRPGGRARSCSRRASPCRGRWRPSSCSREDWGVARRRLVGDRWNELRRDGLAADEHAFLHPDEPTRTPVRDPAAAGAPRPGRRGERLHARGAGPDPRSGCPATTRRSAPTASASPTPAPRPGGTSRSTARRSAVRALQQLAARGEVDADGAARRPIEKYRLLRRHRRHVRQRGRRQLT